MTPTLPTEQQLQDSVMEHQMRAAAEETGVPLHALREWGPELRRWYEALNRLTVMAPIDMVLHCPACGAQHIDAPEELPMPPPGSMFEGSAGWSNPPHRSHLCGGCGHIWRPADVPTNGVFAVRTKGKADSPSTEALCQLYAKVGREMVAMTTTVRGPDEWPAIPGLWKSCMEERDAARPVAAGRQLLERAREALQWSFERIAATWPARDRVLGGALTAIDAHLSKPAEPLGTTDAAVKYSYEWFIAASRQAQDEVGKWPESMKQNTRIGVAVLPVLGELRGGLKAPQAAAQPVQQVEHKHACSTHYHARATCDCGASNPPEAQPNVVFEKDGMTAQETADAFTTAWDGPAAKQTPTRVEACARKIEGNRLIAGSPGPLFDMGWSSALESAAEIVRKDLATPPAGERSPDAQPDVTDEMIDDALNASVAEGEAVRFYLEAYAFEHDDPTTCDIMAREVVRTAIDAAITAIPIAGGFSNAEILAVADHLFPRWREDIQEKFVLMLGRGVLEAAQPKAAGERSPDAQPHALTWYEGAPPFPQDQEWFIAETTYGDRVVLRSLDEGREHQGSYAFRTADSTFLKAEVVKRWMQFPDCEYLPPATTPSAQARGGEHADAFTTARDGPAVAQPVAWQMRTKFRDEDWKRWSECADLPEGELLEQVTGPLTMQFRPLYATTPVAGEQAEARPVASFDTDAVYARMEQLMPSWNGYGKSRNGAVAVALTVVRELLAATPPAGERSTPAEPQASILDKAHALIDEAKACGVILSIDQKPLSPLAMGHYESVAHVWQARNAREVVLTHGEKQ